MNKPDRWERMVARATAQYDLINSDVVKLLRRQHRAVIRLVQESKCPIDNPDSYRRGYNLALEDILAKLKERAR